MKRISALIIGVFSVGSLWASDVTYNENMVNGSVVSDTNYTIDCGSKFVDYLAVQAVYNNNSYVPTVGSTSTINAVDNTIVSTQPYVTGLGVYLTTTTLTGVNLTNGVTYFVLLGNTGFIKLATTKANAIAGTFIDITSAGTQGTFTLTPCTLQNAATYSFKWQASNDGTNFYDLSVTSITILAANTTAINYIWDFAKVNYQYIRCALTSGTLGAISLKLHAFGRKVAP